MAAFDRYVGIDYSGAQTPTSSLKGLRVYAAERDTPPSEVPPPPGPRKYWTRRGIAEWLVERLAETPASLVGIDHGFSFPLRYFETHRLLPDWPSFLDDFQRHWPTDREHMYVDFVRDGLHGNGALRWGKARWRRVTEVRAGSAKSVFHFDVQGTVAKSTHAGIPWLRHIRRQVGQRVHFWPFDGWTISAGPSAIVEVYPSLWRRRYPPADRTPDQHDAYCAAEGMRRADLDGDLPRFLHTLPRRHGSRGGRRGGLDPRCRIDASCPCGRDRRPRVVAQFRGSVRQKREAFSSCRTRESYNTVHIHRIHVIFGLRHDDHALRAGD